MTKAAFEKIADGLTEASEIAKRDALIASQAKRIAELEGGAVAEIAAERRRQVEVEGWMPEDDDELHQNGEMALAAGAYASFAGAGQHLRDYLQDQGKHPLSWPWAPAWWKPTTRRRDLVKAGALILAEIERLDRARATLKGETP